MEKLNKKTTFNDFATLNVFFMNSIFIVDYRFRHAVGFVKLSNSSVVCLVRVLSMKERGLKLIEQPVQGFIEKKRGNGRQRGFDCVKGKHYRNLRDNNRLVGYSVKREQNQRVARSHAYAKGDAARNEGDDCAFFAFSVHINKPCDEGVHRAAYKVG